jgi:hypothetical protein
MVWEGKQWTEPGRVQLWTSNHQPRSATGPKLLSTDSTIDTRGGLLTPSTSIPTIASQPPMISKLSFERDSRLSVLSAQTGASHRTELSSVGAASMQFVPVDGNGNLGAVLEIPDSPSLVILLPAMLLVVKGSSSVLGSCANISLTFLVTDDVNIKPGKCDCLAEETNGNQRCRRIVLKSSRSYIQASHAAPNKSVSGYNICGAGRFQREGMMKVEKLKRVMIDFQSVNGMRVTDCFFHIRERRTDNVLDRVRFVKHYKELQQINRLNERGIL